MSDLTKNVVAVKISKLDAARRQLVTAIRLYFANADSVSTHTLAAAAFEILGDLDAHGPNTGTLFDHAERYIKPEYVDVFYKKLRKPQNFFKHADNDPEDILEFYPTGGSRYSLGSNREILRTNQRGISRVGSFPNMDHHPQSEYSSLALPRSSRAVGPRERLLCGYASAVFRSRA
jgi:hypothetical protein